MTFRFEKHSVYTVKCEECGHVGSFEAASVRLLRMQMSRYGWSFGRKLRCSDCEARNTVSHYGNRINAILGKGECSTNRIASQLFASPTVARYRSIDNALKHMEEDGQVIGLDNDGIKVWRLPQ